MRDTDILFLNHQKQNKVMFRFDNDEPKQICSLDEGSEFIIKLKDNSVMFEKDGKSFKLYID